MGTAEPPARTAGAYAAISAAQNAPQRLPGVSYVESLGLLPPEALQAGNQVVTSFVPDAPGPYRDFLLKGEAAFRAARYAAADDQFKLANYVFRRDAESLLSLAHSQLAMGQFSLAAYYLQQALKYFPELPLVRLRLQGFFGSEQQYADAVVRLKTRLLDYPSDPQLLLCLAYVQWFSDPRDINATQESLRLAMRSSRGTETVEAARIFHDAVSASADSSAQTQTAPASSPAGGPATRTSGPP